MANSEIFGDSATLKDAASIINGIEAKKLERLLQRIIVKLHIPNEKPFGEEEEEKLKEAFELNKEQLDLVIETISFVFETAAYHQMSPKNLDKHLALMLLGKEQATEFCKCWAAKGGDLVAFLRDQAFAPRKLSNVNWRLNIQLSQASLAKTRAPNAMFEFTIDSKSGDERVKMEFDHAQLFSFYTQLEVIQQQLDQLS